MMMFHRFNRRIITSSVSFSRTFLITTENTPNPHSLKFLPGREVLPESHGTGLHFDKNDARQLSRSPLAKALLDLPGCKTIFLGRDFISVTKESEINWSRLKPIIFSEILDFFSQNKEVVVEVPEVSDTTILETDNEVVAAIKELIETRVRPSVQEDGGDIFYLGFDEETGIVKVKLAGSCVGCPSSSITLRNGVENMLMHYIPEVKGIQDLTGEDDSEDRKLSFKPEPL